MKTLGHILIFATLFIHYYLLSCECAQMIKVEINEQELTIIFYVKNKTTNYHTFFHLLYEL